MCEFGRKFHFVNSDYLSELSLLGLRLVGWLILHKCRWENKKRHRNCVKNVRSSLPCCASLTLWFIPFSALNTLFVEIELKLSIHSLNRTDDLIDLSVCGEENKHIIHGGMRHKLYNMVFFSYSSNIFLQFFLLPISLRNI